MMHTVKKTLVICFAALMFTSAFGAENAEPDKSLVYKAIGGHKLQLHLFNP
jgi:hypothetical protein